MDGRTEMVSFVRVNVFIGWLFLTMILFFVGWLVFGNFGLAIVAITSVFIGWRIIRHFHIQDLVWRLHQLRSLKKIHAIRPYLIDEVETNREIISLEKKLARYGRG
jgi:hypothetical protein